MRPYSLARAFNKKISLKNPRKRAVRGGAVKQGRTKPYNPGRCELK